MKLVQTDMVMDFRVMADFMDMDFINNNTNPANSTTITTTITTITHINRVNHGYSASNNKYNKSSSLSFKSCFYLLFNFTLGSANSILSLSVHHVSGQNISLLDLNQQFVLQVHESNLIDIEFFHQLHNYDI
jgi:hypothetical protein